jgi:hypothetical protein
MNPTSKDIADMINDYSGFSQVWNTDLFFGRMPEENKEKGIPANLVVVFDNPGSPPLLTYAKSTSNYYYSSVSIWVRNKSYEEGYEEAFTIMQYFHGLRDITTDEDILYTLITAQGEPQLLKFDENDRAVFLTNYLVQRRAAS